MTYQAQNIVSFQMGYLTVNKENNNLKDINELLEIKGIGKRTLENIKNDIQDKLKNNNEIKSYNKQAKYDVVNLWVNKQ